MHDAEEIRLRERAWITYQREHTNDSLGSKIYEGSIVSKIVST